MDSGKLKEEQVLTKQYSNVCNTLQDIDNLLPHFVEEDIITTDDLEEINATVPSTKKLKAQKLLSYILGPLKARNTHGFYKMLRIMEEYGNQATCELASRIKVWLLAEQPNQSGQDHSASMGEDRMLLLPQPCERNVIKLQLTRSRGVYIVGATLLFCLFVLVLLLAIILVIVTLIYFSAGKDEAMFYAKLMYGHGIQKLSPEFYTKPCNFVDQCSMLQYDASKFDETCHECKDGREELTTDEPIPMVSAPVDIYTTFDNDLVAPVVFNISNFTAKVRNKEHWISDPFFAFEGGYNLIFAVGYPEQVEDYLSVFMIVRPGPFDDKLQLSGHFPLTGYFTLEILSHTFVTSNLAGYISPKYHIPDVTRAYKGGKFLWWGSSRFVFLDRIQTEQYLKDDTIYFRISYSKYRSYARMMVLLPVIPLLLILTVYDNCVAVFAILTVIEFVAFTIDKASILKPTCIDFSFSSMKLFLSTNQPLLMNTAWCVFYNSVKDFLKVMALILLEVSLIAVYELTEVCDVDIPGFDLQAAIFISRRITFVIPHSLLFDRYKMSWEGTICMVNPVWCVVLWCVYTNII